MLNQRRLRRELAGDRSLPVSRFGPVGGLARRAILRVGRPLAVPGAARDTILAEMQRDVRLQGICDGLALQAVPTAEVTEAATDVGPLLLHANDGVMTVSISEAGIWEADEAAWLRRVVRPGATVLDIGANVGYFTLLVAGLAGEQGTVVAVEPEHRNLSLLRANLWQHGFDDVIVLPIAAWSSRALLPLVVSEFNRGDHQVRPDKHAASAHLVPAAALDSLLGAHATVDVVKVDTQGVDHEVIRGLRATLERSRDPKVLVEFWLDGMEDRQIDAGVVLAGYRELGFDLALLNSDGTEREATDGEVIAACNAWHGGFVNLVLRRTKSRRR